MNIEPNRFSITVDDTTDESIFTIVRDGLRAYNHASYPEWFNLDTPEEPLYLTVRDSDNTIIAGLIGRIYWSSLFINYLWVSEALRGNGVGQQLIRQAEVEAQQRGCTFAWLTTFDFQAPEFYRKLDYQVTGQLDNHPPGHTLYTMRKDLSQPQLQKHTEQHFQDVSRPED